MSPSTRRRAGGVRRGSLDQLRRESPPIFTRTRQPKAAELSAPQDWPGTTPEYVVFQTLVSFGLRPGVDFSYQSSQMGGRGELGGAVVDFLVHDPERGINVNEPYWHLRRGAEHAASDQLQRAGLERLGIPMVYIDADELVRDPIFYVREALQGRDHSRFTRGY